MEVSDCSIDQLLLVDALQEVWLGVDRSTGRDVLVRLLKLPMPRNERRRFERMAGRYGQARHPRLQAVRGLVEGTNPGVIVDRAVGTMAQWVELHGPLPMQTVVEVGTALLEALSFCHLRRLYHGTLHPGAVWVDETGGIVLGELAIGQLVFETETRLPAEALWQRVPFMAPELRLRQSPPSIASDLYSVAATLVWLAKGGDFAGDLHVPEVCDRLEGKLPTGFLDVMRKAAAWNPSCRYADADTMATALSDAALDFEDHDCIPVDLTDLPGPIGDPRPPRERDSSPEPCGSPSTSPSVGPEARRPAPQPFSSKSTRAHLIPWAIAAVSVGVAYAALAVS